MNLDSCGIKTEQLRSLWSTLFEYTFEDEQYARKFATEQRIGSFASGFALLALFISCIGIFGMASFVAEQRRKEIGVRKVLGASVINLWRLLSREFVLLVFISLGIAAPLVYQAALTNPVDSLRME